MPLKTTALAPRQPLVSSHRGTWPEPWLGPSVGTPLLWLAEACCLSRPGGAWERAGGWPDEAQRAGTPWVRSCLPHTSGIPADRYLLPQPSGYSAAATGLMRPEEVLIVQSLLEARGAVTEPGLPVCGSHGHPHPSSRRPSRWTVRAGCPPAWHTTSARVNPVPWLVASCPPSHCSPRKPGQEMEPGVRSQRAFPLGAY